MANILKSPYKVFSITMLFFLIYGLVLQPIDVLIAGYISLIQAPALLITDYVYVGGFGPSLLNSALTSFMALGMLLLFKHEMKSGTIAGLWLIAGFAFFGKNPINILPIFIGGFLYAKFMRQPYTNTIIPILVATSLAPAVNQTWAVSSYLTGIEALAASYIFSVIMGLFIGFIFAPLAANFLKIHDGYNLYNGGLTAGVIAIIIIAFFSSHGVYLEINSQWSTGYHLQMSVFIVIISIWLLFVGFYQNRNLSECISKIKEINKTHNDYWGAFGSVSYINMALLGLYCIAAAAVLHFTVGFQLNGPILGAVISVMGFGMNGKNVPSAFFLMLGVSIATLLTANFELYHPGIGVILFFVPCLSPIPTKFGWYWGIVAGFIHLHVATSLAVPSGGINLYNNGLAAGFVVMLILPIIRSIVTLRENLAAGKA